jgi:hypothetical protein
MAMPTSSSAADGPARETLVSTEETSTQVRVIFDRALVAQGLDELLTDDRLDLDVGHPERPILLAVSQRDPRSLAS